MNSKYRTYDTSTNIIISTKHLSNQYIPYRNNFKQQPSQKSIKRINYQYNSSNNSHNCRVFQKNKLPNRILSKNDRLDLYLSGGQILQTSQNNRQSSAHQHRIFFRGGKLKRKQFMSTAKPENIIFKNQTKTLYQSNHQVNDESLHQSPKSISPRKQFLGKAQKLKKKDQLSLNVKRQSPKSIKIQENQSFSNQQQFQNQVFKNDNNLKAQELSQNIIQKQMDFSQNLDEIQQPKRAINLFKAKKCASLNYNSTNKCNSNNTQYSSIPRKEFVKRKNQTAITHKKSKKKLIQSLNKSDKIDTKIKPLFYFNQKQLSNIKAQSFIVTQYPSGQVIAGNYYKKFAEIASLTKIMTFYTIYQISILYKIDIDSQLVQIDEEVQAMSGTSAELYAGQIFTVTQLLYGLMLPSGNDAATALGKWGGIILSKNKWQGVSPIRISSSQAQKDPLKLFLSFMNKTAKDINMINSKFYNPHGLPNNQSGSTPFQMALLVHQCLKIQLFKTIINTKSYSCYTQNETEKRQALWQNTNKLLRRKNFIGGKTGVTVTAGPCLATCYKTGDKIFIIILLRTTKLSRRFKETRLILGTALNKLNSHLYSQDIRQIYKQDKQLDSDNSQDQMQFEFDRNDPKQMTKRNKILTYQM